LLRLAEEEKSKKNSILRVAIARFEGLKTLGLIPAEKKPKFKFDLFGVSDAPDKGWKAAVKSLNHEVKQRGFLIRFFRKYFELPSTDYFWKACWE
jgi:hypothetical protein